VPLGTTNSVGHSDDSRAVSLLMSTYEWMNYERVESVSGTMSVSESLSRAN